MAEEKKEVKEQEGIVWHENTEAPEFYPEKLIQKVDNCGSDFIRLRKAKFKMKTNFIANILQSAKAFI